MVFWLKFAVPDLRFPIRHGNREPLKKAVSPFPVPSSSRNRRNRRNRYHKEAVQGATMRAKNTLILWNSKETAETRKGPFEVRLAPRGIFPAWKEYHYSSGAAYPAFAQAQPKDQAIMLMALALELIVFYGLPAKHVDDTLRLIDEYRKYAFLVPGSNLKEQHP